MEPIDLLSADRVRMDVAATSKKKLLEKLSGLLASDHDAQVEEAIFDALISRERQSPTGLGAGIAIPHGRIDGQIEPVAAFVRLKQPLSFDAIDGAPVDLVFALIIPSYFTGEHLGLLGRIAEMFSDHALVGALRATTSSRELFQQLQGWYQR